ncbi:MAG: methylated-DNA--[protein]-cysteine S-methyltransferase [Christensenellales bacterium]
MTGYAFYESKYGYFKIGYENGAITMIRTAGEIDAPNAPCALTDCAFEEVRAYLAGARQAFDFPMAPRGTEFQQKVWRALGEIPYGETRTYAQIAAAAGNPRASRAVGMANNRNPIMIAIPCHRVIGADGSLTGYAGGLDMKRELLAMEAEMGGAARG